MLQAEHLFRLQLILLLPISLTSARNIGSPSLTFSLCYLKHILIIIHQKKLNHPV